MNITEVKDVIEENDKIVVFRCPVCGDTPGYWPTILIRKLYVGWVFEFEKRIEEHEKYKHEIEPTPWPEKPNLRTSWGLAVLEHWSDLG